MDDHLRGIGGVSWVVLPTYGMMRPIWRKFMAAAPEHWVTDLKGNEVAPDYIKIGTHTIEFKTGQNPERLVAEGLRRLWCDESGLIKERAWIESLQPALIDHAAPALLTGTPKGRNWFYEVWKQGLRVNGVLTDPDIESFSWTSFANPFIEAKEIMRLSKTMPRRMWEQEILARFLDDEGAVFRNVRALVKAYQPGEPVAFGIDLARHHDFTVIIGLDKAGRLAYFQRFRKIAWALQKERIMRAVNMGRYATVFVDATGSGDPVAEDLAAMGVNLTPFVFTHQSKTQLVNALELAIEERPSRLMLWDEPVLINELEAYEHDTTPAGNVRYGAPEGKYDDCVMALGLAWLAWLSWNDYGLTIFSEQQRQERERARNNHSLAA
jgi:hypothetical protein